MNKCKICKTGKLFNEHLCKECLEDLRGAFHYGIGGKEVSKESYDRITKRGYVISEELDGDRK